MFDEWWIDFPEYPDHGFCFPTSALEVQGVDDPDQPVIYPRRRPIRRDSQTLPIRRDFTSI